MGMTDEDKLYYIKWVNEYEDRIDKAIKRGDFILANLWRRYLSLLFQEITEKL